jgi:excisionase family DNA binding protein
MSPETPTSHQQSTYSTSEAAERLELSEEVVRELCRKERFQPKAEKDERGHWRIPVVAVDNWLQQNQTPHKTNLSQWLVAEGPPTSWERFRYHPWVFYPTIAFTVVAAVVVTMAAVVSAGADLGPATEQARKLLGIRAFRPASDDETLIVIATFDYAEGVADARPHNEIRNAIRKAAGEMKFNQLRVEVAPTC